MARAIATNSSWNLVGSSSAGVGFGPEEPLLPRRRTDWWSAVLAEFFRIKLAETCYESVDLLPADHKITVLIAHDQTPFAPIP